MTDPKTTRTSARAKFKEIPVNPSILKYIQNVGVGIPKRYDKKLIRAKRRNQKRSGVLSREEEMDRFGCSRRSTNKTPPLPFAAPNKGTNGEQHRITRYPVKLIGSVGSINEDFPTASKRIPEVALAGRSNVGKSTLLNALLYGNNQKVEEQDSNDPATTTTTFRRRITKKGPTRQTAKLPKGLKAVTSATPGETRRVSFYQLSAKEIVDNDANNKISMLLVDLPGYGFAYASEEQANRYKSLMESYILDRGGSLKRLLLLIDARHGMKITDMEFLESLQVAMDQRNNDAADTQKKRGLPPIQIVLTKCDLVPQVDIARRVALVRQQLSSCLRREAGNLAVMMVSAQMEGQAGVLELQKELASLVPKKQLQKRPLQQEQNKKN